MRRLESIYAGKRVLVTGHTGFKGAWLCRWLEILGARVSGYSLPAAAQSNLHSILSPTFDQTFADLRDSVSLARHIHDHRPEIVFHLAAQPLVRESYLNPLETFGSNIAGLWSLLSGLTAGAGLQAVVVATTDKCYRNDEDGAAFREDHPLGGKDPYSASKACAEIICHSWQSSFWSVPGAPRLATARSGNVIGGGDWATDRLIPDAVRAADNGRTLSVRNPDSVRPWLHVLETLHGYLLLGGSLLEPDCIPGAWNFGPEPGDCLPVRDILQLVSETWPGFAWEATPGDHPAEASLLLLDAAKAHALLGWAPLLSPRERIAWAIEWYRGGGAGDARSCDAQIRRFQELAS